MNVQTIIDASMAANATSMGSGEASKIFRESYANSMKCRIQLKADDRSYLTRTTTFPLVFTGEKAVTNDHPVLCAMRELSREAYHQTFKIMHMNQRALVIGAAAREIRLYNSNPSIHYLIHGKENKDYDRIILPALSDIAAELKKKASKNDRSVFLEPPEKIDTTTVRPALARYFTVKQLVDDYVRHRKMPANIHTDPIEAQVLLFEDSIYNFGAEELCELFSQTNANIAYGYCLLPMELLFGEMPSNRIYWFETYRDQPAVKHTLSDVFGRKMASLTFRQGFSNGYVHEYDKWRTLLAQPAMKHKGVSLCVEITARVGCMAVFKIYRCQFPEKMVRTIELQPHESYVELLDLYASIDHRTCKMRRPLKYFKVLECEFFSTYNFLVGLDPKSMSLQNCILYTRRCMGGMSLSSKELLHSWDLPASDVYRYCIAVYIQASLMHEKIEKGIELSNPTSVWEKFKRLAVAATRYAFYPIALLIELILSENLTDKIVVWPDHNNCITQRATLYPLLNPNFVNIPLYADFPNEEKLSGCPFCDFMNEEIEQLDFKDGLKVRGPRRGKQIYKCAYKPESDHVFKLTEKECSEIIAKLRDDDEDPEGIKKVKALAKEKFPRAGFEHKCRVSYIRGGPGTGKSYAIRAQADIKDLILAPFTKLMSDYMNVKSADGTVDLCFKTQHRGVAETGHRIIMVDEFSSFPYEMLAAAAYLNQAEEIILVGDERQTKIRAPSEGIYIGDQIKLQELSQHELTVNFRNPKGIVDILNEQFGYEMVSVSKNTGLGYMVVPPSYALPTNCMRMAFTDSAAKAFVNAKDAKKKNTVRSNQGGTFPVCALDITTDNGNLTSVDELVIVAISRHTDMLYIVSDGSESAKNFLSKIGDKQDWTGAQETYVQPPPMLVKPAPQPPSLEDTIIDLPMEHPPKDAHLLSETLLPKLVVAEQAASLNELTSQVVPDTFRSGKTNLVDLLVPQNVRGHVINYQQSFRSFSAGNGLSYSSKLPMQELAVVTTRYDNVKPRMKFDHEAKKLAEKMVDEYFERFKLPDAKWYDVLTEDVIAARSNDFLRDAIKKHYPERYAGEKDKVNPRDIRFHLKEIFKPTTSFKGLDLWKAGQGIAAWSAEAVTIFCFAFRLMGLVDRMTNRKGTDVYCLDDQEKSEIEFLEEASKAVKAVVGGLPAKHGLADGIQFDSMQDEFTQYQEIYYWKKLGFSDLFLSHYYSFRSHYKIIAKTVSATPNFEKNSGEPGTLVNNGIVMKVNASYMLYGEGPCIQMSKGDDIDNIQCNMRIDEDRRKEVEARTVLRLKYKVADTGDFCGYTIGPDGFLPNLYRRFLKITACRWRNYNHFCEYQKSLRDYIKVVDRIGPQRCITQTMADQHCSSEEATAILYAINSWAHIDEQQWLQITSSRTVSPSYPVMDPDSERGVVLTM